MAKRSKSYRNAAQKIADGVLYSPLGAMRLAKEASATKFDATVEVTFRLGVNPRKADQMVRGTVNLLHGTGRTTGVLVFAVGPCAQEAIGAGADEVGDDELIEKVAGDYTDSDTAVATPGLMGKVGCLGCVLGPHGLMPSPKTDTVTMDVAEAVSGIKGGRIEFRVGKNGNLSFIVSKASFTPGQLVESYAAAQEEVLHPKPSTSRSRYLPRGTIATMMGPNIPLDTSKTHNLASEDPS